jgi:hypothetical protein
VSARPPLSPETRYVFARLRVEQLADGASRFERAMLAREARAARAALVAAGAGDATLRDCEELARLPWEQLVPALRARARAERQAAGLPERAAAGAEDRAGAPERRARVIPFAGRADLAHPDFGRTPEGSGRDL